MKRGLEESSEDGTKRIRVDDNGEAHRSIYVGFLPPFTTPTHLLDLVNTGAIDKCHLIAGKPYGFITFVDEASASAFLAEAQESPKQIMGKQIQIGMGTGKNLPEDVAKAVAEGATRNIFLGGVNESMTHDFLRHHFGRFGEIDCVDVIYSKHIAFVHFCSVMSALKCKAALSENPQWARHRLNFGPDRCAPGGKKKKYADDRPPRARLPMMGMGPMGGPMGGPPVGGPRDRPPMGGPPMMGGPGGGRTIWLGGVTELSSAHDICNHVHEGILEELRMMPAKKCAFLSFISPASAAQFHSQHVMNGFHTETSNLKVGWGKPRDLPRDVMQALDLGASRNLFLGNIDESVSEPQLRADLSEFGEIEKCDVLLGKRIAFVNFLSIKDAVRCANELRNPESALYQKGYGQFRVNFGKDRCAFPDRRGPPRQSFPQSNGGPAMNGGPHGPSDGSWGMGGGPAADYGAPHDFAPSAAAVAYANNPYVGAQ